MALYSVSYKSPLDYTHFIPSAVGYSIELNEVDLMTLLGNIQIATPERYARLRRVDVTVTLV